MRVLIVAFVLALTGGIATAEQNKTAKPGDAAASTGRTTLSTQGVAQPQGPTGPIETKSGGAPAESPQGQTPPGMQSAPDGSDKTIVEQK